MTDRMNNKRRLKLFINLFLVTTTIASELLPVDCDFNQFLR